MSPFKELVARMREAQRQYFATRDREWLREAKRLEKQVDEALNKGNLFEPEFTESDLFAAFKQGSLHRVGDIWEAFKQWKNIYFK